MEKLWTAVLLAIILVPTGVLLNSYFNLPEHGDDFVRVGKVNIHFGSMIEDCMQVPIDEEAASDLLKSQEFITLFDPDGVSVEGKDGAEVVDDLATRKYAIATYEVSRILVPLGHKAYSAYTKPYLNDSTSVRTLADGNPALPIILFEIGDETSVRRFAPGQIVVSGIDEEEINHAACRLDLEILKQFYGITLPKAPE